jgi:acyl-CoA synthetase (AMP-forming)/AMP-acid ligase II
VIEACAIVYDASAAARMTAYVVTRDGSTPEIDSLEAMLPSYMIPRRVLQVGTLPLNANGKVDYHLLRVQGEQLSEDWQTQRIINEVEGMTHQDVLSALAHAASSPMEK